MRFFNTAGPCRPDRHYMLPAEKRLPSLRQLIEREHYFVLHAPRQSGKTTLVRAVVETLLREAEVVAVHATCETGQTARSDVERGVRALVRAIDQETHLLAEELRPEPPENVAHVEAEAALREYLARWSRKSPLPVVLFLDEIDALLDDTLLSVLRQLRAGYPSRPRQYPASIALIGLRDVRDYRADVRGQQESLGTASPFNIKVESLTLRDFSREEVGELYAQHTEETGQPFTSEAVDLAWDLSRGQPWLVNALARQMVEELATDRGEPVGVEHVLAAKEILIERRDTHLDSLIDRLREPRVQKVLEPILAGSLPADDVFDDDVAFVKDLGLVAVGPSGLEVANPIYREIVPRALTALTQDLLPIERKSYIGADGRLLFDKLLDDFIAFWREHAESFLVRQPYSEAAAQLIFLAYLHKIVNGGAHVGGATISREYAVGSGRMDLLVSWPHGEGVDRFAIELKTRRGGDSDPLEKGLDQLAGYLLRLGLEQGTLILFDQRRNAPPLPERISRQHVEQSGKRIQILRL